MLENFIYAKRKLLFETALNNGEVLDEAIVFIEDTKEIWNHGTYFDGSTFDPTDIEASILNILDTKADKTEIPTKVSELENDIPYVVDDVIPENGVYAVRADGSLCTVEEADESCIGVALIQDEHKFWIEKNETNNTTSIKAAYTEDGASNTNYKYFYWGMNGSDNTSITNYTQTGGGGTSTSGYLPQANGSYASSSNNLSGDYTTWTSGALSDFNGKANTAALLTASDTDSYTNYANMATWCRIFNQTETENQGYSDWYIPAFGQLALMSLNMTAINNALTKIGGQTISPTWYWSSSEYSYSDGWLVDFGTGYVKCHRKNYNILVRFVRDFTLTKLLKERVSEIESQIGDINTILEYIISGGPNIITFSIKNVVEYQAEEGMTWEEFVNSSYNDGSFSISDNDVMYGGNKIIDGDAVNKLEIIKANYNYSITAADGGSN